MSLVLLDFRARHKMRRDRPDECTAVAKVLLSETGPLKSIIGYIFL